MAGDAPSTAGHSPSREIPFSSLSTVQEHAMYFDEPTITELPTDECWDLLRTREVGRLGVNADGFPQVLPMNYAVDGDTVVVRSRPGAKLRSADGQPVSFEID